ncbi:efflux transporter outer membrane subunit [Chitinimonas sp.]|uniref:efflux transporter outer membrane subunit n=1 Tax=Chitinimonas sp. TaxID=1934313 RepID=UPI002F921ED8
MPARKPSFATAALTTLLLAACAGPVAPMQPIKPPAEFKEAGLWQRAAATQGSEVTVPTQWWTLFDDSTLNALQQQLIIGNENLKGTAAQVASAQAAVSASESALWPTLSVGASASRAGSPGADGRPRSTTNSYGLTASASWELDLWGRLGKAEQVAGARLQASRDDLSAARLSAQASLVQSYFSLRSAEVQQDLLARSIAAYQRSVALTQARYAAGVVSRSDVLQAETQLRSVQAQALDVAAQRAQLEHAVAVLLGQPPAALSLASTAKLPAVPAVPSLLPTTLLERRPDIAAAERRVAAAYAQIGVADTAWFPSLTLGATAGYRGSTLSSLVSAPNLAWSFGPSLTEAIFDSGARKLASAQARASADEAAAGYRQTVLTALQEVEDNLVLAHQLAGEAKLQTQAVDAARRNLEIVQDQYKAGTVSFLNVASAQTELLNSELSLNALQTRQLLAVNQLLKNIAGTWRD